MRSLILGCAIAALALPAFASQQVCGSFAKANAALVKSGFATTFAGDTSQEVRYVIFANEETGAWAAFAVKGDDSCMLV